MRFALFGYLKPETRIRLLERRRAFLEGRGSSLQDALRSYKERIDNYTLSLMKHELDATESDIRWLDDLIRSEQMSVGRSLRPRRAARLAQRERT